MTVLSLTKLALVCAAIFAHAKGQACSPTSQSPASPANANVEPWPTDMAEQHVQINEPQWRIAEQCWDRWCSAKPDHFSMPAPYTWHSAHLQGGVHLACQRYNSATVVTAASSSLHSGSYASFSGSSSSAIVFPSTSDAKVVTYSLNTSTTIHQYRLASSSSAASTANPAVWRVLGRLGNGDWAELDVRQSAPWSWQGETLVFPMMHLHEVDQVQFVFNTTTVAGNNQPFPIAIGSLRLQTCNASDIEDDLWHAPHVLATYPTRIGSYYFISQATLPDMVSHAGPVPLTYQLGFTYRQARTNSVRNSRLPEVRLALSLVHPDAQVNVSEVGSLRAYDFSPVGEATTSSVTFTTNTTVWKHFSVDFTLPRTCTGCRVALLLRNDDWVSNGGNIHYLKNLTWIRKAVDIPSRVITDGATEVATIPRQSYTVPAASKQHSARSACPFAEAGLVRWDAAATWPNGYLPVPGANVTLPENAKVLLRGCSGLNYSYAVVTIPASSALIFDDADISFQAQEIKVYGRLAIGSETCPIYSNVHIRLLGDRYYHYKQGTSKGIVSYSGSTLDMHGQWFASWTRLASTVFPGDDVIQLQDAVNWQAGMKIVLVTSIWRDEEDNQNQVVTIEGVSADGKRLKISPSAQHQHYAGQEYQVEVGLLTRRITIDSDDSGVSGNFGGHMLVHRGAIGRFQGVLAHNMGQTNQLARYPFHFHMMGTAPTSYVKQCSVWKSNYRCVVVHGTNDTVISQNVAFDITGHCYYLEDGVEENNLIEYNLAAYVHVIGRPAQGWGQPGETFIESPALLNPADASAAGFYITNAMNSFVGNTASGGWTGFAFPNLPEPILLHRGMGRSRHNPENRPLKLFDGNVAHSSGYQWNRGSCIYVGGRLRHQGDSNLLHYLSGRSSRNSLDVQGDTRSSMHFTNTKVFLCRRGLNHWGDRAEVIDYEAHDVARSLVLFGSSSIARALIVGHTNNSAAMGRGVQRIGFQYYDTWTSTVVANTTFRNYNTRPDHVFEALTFSDTFKPQQINAAINIRYENVNPDLYLYHPLNEHTGSSWMFNLHDADGSVLKTNEPTIIGSHHPWWNVGDDCRFHSNVNVWSCPKTSDRHIGHLFMKIPGITRTSAEMSTDESHRHIGYFAPLAAAAGDYTRALPLSKNPGSTGMANRVWRLDLAAGAPRNLHVDSLQIPRGSFIVLASEYPAGTSFNITVQKRWAWPAPVNFSLAQAASLEEVLAPGEMQPASNMTCPRPATVPSSQSEWLCEDTGLPVGKWYFNGSMLFVRIEDMRYQNNRNFRTTDFGYEQYGVLIHRITNHYQYFINAHCPPCVEGAPVCQLSRIMPLPVYDIPKPAVSFCPPITTEAPKPTDNRSPNNSDDQAAASGSSSDSTPMVAGAAAGGLVLIALVAAMLVIRNKRTTQGKTTPAATPQKIRPPSKPAPIKPAFSHTSL
eukprot:TRINITY_DN11322_c0_g1_i3.p1 TRINITY_DN11322_c0_g1~~TRINITY_DN11322_c0_g1_i3.p1  ORF type:complete len:1438 (+),score=280.02 TRINITY_DN11322_c0_g1_i3:2619-6932(+)